jgi:hypothetical protein
MLNSIDFEMEIGYGAGIEILPFYPLKEKDVSPENWPSIMEEIDYRLSPYEKHTFFMEDSGITTPVRYFAYIPDIFTEIEKTVDKINHFLNHLDENNIKTIGKFDIFAGLFIIR